ncbi:MAG: L,D-transpeptidase family protein, partial [Candidatus Puniceispirillaceae bacterium]
VAEDQIIELSQLPCRPITPQMGWVDDPESALYNRPVMLPCADRHEQLWREDGLYDLILPLGYNDGPIRPLAGSAIFLHCAEQHTTATEGCVALARADLLSLLPGLAPTTRLILYP